MIQITNRQLELMMEVNGLRYELSTTTLRSEKREIENKISDLLIQLNIK